MNPMNQRIKCRADGCPNEIFYKTVEGAGPVPGQYIDPIERRASGIRSPVVGRGSPGPYGHSHRYSQGGGSTVVSQYCKQHTCIHFLREEGCTNKKPLHDTVCPIHARCPLPDCTQARAQFLDPGYDPNSHSVPRYVRFEFCAEHKCILRSCPRRRTSPKSTYCQAHSCHAEGCLNQSQEQRNCCEEHQCKAGSCRTIVEGNYPYCALHIKCEIASCGRARHSMAPKSDEYLPFCTEHATCEVGRCRELRLNNSSFCGTHTCQERDCKKSANSRPYCNEHSCQDADCPYPRAWAPQLNDRDKFCPLHTCRSQGCQEYVASRAIFCKKHGCSRRGCLSEALVEQLCLDDLKATYIAQGEFIASRKNSMSTSSNMSISSPGPGNPNNAHFSPHAGPSTPVPLHGGGGLISRSSAPTPIQNPGGGMTYRGLPPSRQQQFFQIPGNGSRSGTPVGNSPRGGGGIINLNKKHGPYHSPGGFGGDTTSTDDHDEDDDEEEEDETNDEDNHHNKPDDLSDTDDDGPEEDLDQGVSTLHLSTGALPQAPPAPAVNPLQQQTGSGKGSSSAGPRRRKSGKTNITVGSSHTDNTNPISSSAQSESESEDLNFPDRDRGIADTGFITLSPGAGGGRTSSEGSNSLVGGGGGGGVDYHHHLQPPQAPVAPGSFPVGSSSFSKGKGKKVNGGGGGGRRKARKGAAGGGGKVNGHGHGMGGSSFQHFEHVKEHEDW
ncbi:hypothetical protein V8F33_001374 [Rhypophila sp. PSN 637]